VGFGEGGALKKQKISGNIDNKTRSKGKKNKKNQSLGGGGSVEEKLTPQVENI